MIRGPLVFLSLLAMAAVVACAGPTAPDDGRIRTGGSAQFDTDTPECQETNESGDCESLPPPPPLDTTGAYHEEQSTSNEIRVMYFFNGPAQAGWISFSKLQASGVAASPSARIDYHRGVVSGRGKLTLALSNGSTRVINLATDIVEADFRGDCSRGCFSVRFSSGGTFATSSKRVIRDETIK